MNSSTFSHQSNVKKVNKTLKPEVRAKCITQNNSVDKSTELSECMRVSLDEILTESGVCLKPFMSGALFLQAYS